MKGLDIYKAKVGAYRANHTEEETKKHVEDVLRAEWQDAVYGIAKNYQESVATVAGDAAAVKKYYMTQKGREKELKGKTKARHSERDLGRAPKTHRQARATP
eukprot:TRINITY_DN555_c0_g2_i4.p2 TRINITY_DN555_c0_g2~~TRINITY_DN555_c0_g2_i4.p2  ORF type:complete len:102 (+),score=16.65 TRINITY_DN555_c0_g2_i4:2-307(+)